MQKSGGGTGIKKHRKSGKVHNTQHFTGRKGKTRGVSRKGKGLTRKDRHRKRGTHENKYVP